MEANGRTTAEVRATPEIKPPVSSIIPLSSKERARFPRSNPVNETGGGHTGRGKTDSV